MDGNDGAPQVVRIFESYGWNDAADVAQRLKDSLEEFGYQVWIDRERLRPDDPHFALALEDAVANSEVVVALLSPHSVRGLTGDQRTSICYNEVLLAHRLDRPIVPVRVRMFEGQPPFLINTYRIVDWLNWERPEFYRKGVVEINTLIERALAHETLLDPDITFQTNNFASQLRTAEDTFTGREWLFDRLDAWLSAPTPCLVIEGDTGTGKTAVVAELIRRNPDGRVLAYHFCTPAASTLDPVSTVRSLAGMLASGVHAYAEELHSGRLAKWLTGKDAVTMLSEGILEPLREVAMDGSYYIVIDALDEAFIDAGDSLPVLLAGALPDFPPWLKLLVTSRPHNRVLPLFDAAERCALADGGGNRDDLRAFVTRRLAEPELAAVIDDDQRVATAGRIEAGADGNFQYAGSVLDALASGDLTRDDLDGLPRTLGALYFRRAAARFPHATDYEEAAVLLAVLLAAREPIDVQLLAVVTKRDAAQQVYPTLDTLNCFVGSTGGAWRIAHKSISDWLTSPTVARQFTVDPVLGRALILAHCERWAAHHHPYGMKYVISHLLEAGRRDEALNVVRRGLFEQRRSRLHEPRLDAEDSRKLTAALIAARDSDGVVSLAQTANTWQRDGVASALQAALESTTGETLSFVDGVVARLLTVTG